MAVHNVSTAKYNAATISTGRRPILSDSMLNKKDPNNTPISAALNTSPICASRDFEFLNHCRRHVAHGLDIEPVHDQAQPAQDEGGPLK